MRRWFAEHRLVQFASSNPNAHQANIENALDSFEQPQAPATFADLQRRMDLMTKQATLDVKNAAPTWGRRVRRFVGGKIAGVAGIGVNDAEKAEVSDAIERATRQRTATAEKQIDLSSERALQKINGRARKTSNSFAYLREKSAVCTEILTSLRQDLEAAKTRLQAAKTTKSMDRSQLQLAVDQLSARQRVVEGVHKDVLQRVDGSAESAVLHDTPDADSYLREVIALYKPDRAFDTDGMLMDWVNENASGEPKYKAGTSDLEITLDEASKEMFPDDAAMQKKQYAAMMRIAKRLTGKQGAWRTLGKRMKDSVLPGGAAAVTAAALGGTAAATGGIGALVIGAGLLTRLAYNKIRHGTKTVRGWQDVQIANFYRDHPLQTGKQIAEIQNIPTLPERLAKLRELKPGTRFNVSNLGTAQELRTLTCRGDIVFAVDQRGTRVALDTKGTGGNYYFSFKQPDNSFEHLGLGLSPTTDSLFALI
jgi:hypothetical protein